MKKRINFLYGPILLKTFFIGFISIFVIGPELGAMTAEEMNKAKIKIYSEEAEWQNFLFSAANSSYVFEGKSKEVNIVPILAAKTLSALPMITFENMEFLKGESISEKTFPLPGKPQIKKLQPGGIWFVSLRKIESNNQYVINAMCASTPSRKEQFANLLTIAKLKSEESARR